MKVACKFLYALSTSVRNTVCTYCTVTVCMGGGRVPACVLRSGVSDPRAQAGEGGLYIFVCFTY